MEQEPAALDEPAVPLAGPPAGSQQVRMVRSSSEKRWQARRAVPRRLADTSRQLARVYAQAMAIHDRLDRVRLDALSGRLYDPEEYDQLILAWRAARRAVVAAERARHGRREAGVARTPQA